VSLATDYLHCREELRLAKLEITALRAAMTNAVNSRTACRYLGVGATNLQWLREHGHIQCAKLAGRYVYSLEQLTDYYFAREERRAVRRRRAMKREIDAKAEGRYPIKKKSLRGPKGKDADTGPAA
jgi:hypothetical protein